MKTNLKQLAMFFCFGFAMVCGIRLAEWTIEKPDAMLMVCVMESGESEKDCRYFDDFKGEATE